GAFGPRRLRSRLPGRRLTVCGWTGAGRRRGGLAARLRARPLRSRRAPGIRAWTFLHSGSILLEQFGVDVAETLELQRIAGGVAEEQRALLTGLSPEAHMRFHREVHLFAQTQRQRLPFVEGQHHAAVRHRHTLAVHGAFALPHPALAAERWIVMHHELMPEQIEIDPLRTAATLRQAEAAAVEIACLLEIAHLQRDVEGREPARRLRHG